MMIWEQYRYSDVCDKSLECKVLKKFPAAALLTLSFYLSLLHSQTQTWQADMCSVPRTQGANLKSRE